MKRVISLDTDIRTKDIIQNNRHIDIKSKFWLTAIMDWFGTINVLVISLFQLCYEKDANKKRNHETFWMSVDYVEIYKVVHVSFHYDFLVLSLYELIFIYIRTYVLSQ